MRLILVLISTFIILQISAVSTHYAPFQIDVRPTLRRGAGSLPYHLPEDETAIINEVADEYGLVGDARRLLFVIRKIENGAPGREFGVLHKKALNRGFRVQCEWAAGTIKKRYAGDLRAFAERWAPIGADNDPNGLNNHWHDNASFYMAKWSCE